MCTYIVEKAQLYGSAKAGGEWAGVGQANVYFDHPFHVQLDHALGIDFMAGEGPDARRLAAVELSAQSAERLAHAILAALAAGARAHAIEPEPAL